VTSTEPLPPTSPLWQLPSVLLTPHVAAVVAGDWHARTVLFLENLRRYLAGRPLANRVDLDQGY
jgi:phosphoglycerate dehydrogenase-like enzyme